MTNIYTLPTMNQSENIFGMLTYVNDVSEGYFFTGMLMAVFAIIFFNGLFRTSASKSLAFASYISFVISIILAVLNLINYTYMYLLLFLTAISTLWLMMDKESVA